MLQIVPEPELSHDGPFVSHLVEPTTPGNVDSNSIGMEIRSDKLGQPF